MGKESTEDMWDRRIKARTPYILRHMQVFAHYHKRGNNSKLLY